MVREAMRPGPRISQGPVRPKWEAETSRVILCELPAVRGWRNQSVFLANLLQQRFFPRTFLHRRTIAPDLKWVSFPPAARMGLHLVRRAQGDIDTTIRFEARSKAAFEVVLITVGRIRVRGEQPWLRFVCEEP